MNQSTHKLIYSAVQKFSGDEVELNSVTELEGGAHGFSGAEIRYFDVTYSISDLLYQRTLVVKNAELNERKTYAHLNSQNVSIPLSYSDDLVSNVPQPLCLQHVGNPVQKGEQIQKSAEALAKLHAANLGNVEELSWLPTLDVQYVKEFLLEACWRRAWSSLSQGGEFIDGNGHNHGNPKSGGDFTKAFGGYEKNIKEEADKLVETVNYLWANPHSLTLIHGDLHNDHFYFDGQEVHIIDWGSARFGPFYFDLPNFFTREEALIYRAELEALGHKVPETTFLAHFDAVKSFVGFKYFGIGLWNWCFSDPPHQNESVMHFINMIIA